MKEQLQKIIEQNISKITLSAVKKAVKTEYKKIVITPFLKNEEVVYQIEYFKNNQVLHKNIKKDELALYLEDFLSNIFIQCVIVGDENDYHINCFKDKLQIKKKASSSKLKLNEHNRKKEYILNEYEDIDFLKYLGIMNNEGKVLKAKYNKFRQINKYLELLTSSIDSLPKDSVLNIVDFGCGKAYLTFALYYYLTKILNRKAVVTGLDLKEDVIDFCNKVKDDLSYDNLQFKKGDIKDYDQNKDVDMVIMLHACDNATDEGIIQSLKFNSKVIISVPCCQHELFNKVSNTSLDSMLQFGLIKERFSALATDSIRAQLLKSLGYEVVVMEFIQTEHTPKNIAIKAVKKQGFNNKEFEEFKKFKAFLNLDDLYIEKRLIEEKLL